jgi:hypothetical protein
MLVPVTVADINAGQYFLVPDAKPMSLGTIASTIIVGSDRADFARPSTTTISKSTAAGSAALVHAIIFDTDRKYGKFSAEAVRRFK